MKKKLVTYRTPKISEYQHNTEMVTIHLTDGARKSFVIVHSSVQV